MEVFSPESVQYTLHNNSRLCVCSIGYNAATPPTAGGVGQYSSQQDSSRETEDTETNILTDQPTGITHILVLIRLRQKLFSAFFWP